VASIKRTAYPRFTPAVPVREPHEAFTPAAGEIAWAREQTRTPEHLLALVVLLKSCHRLGYFPVLAEVPPTVTEHIRGVLELNPDVRAWHDSDRTVRQHKSLVRARLGITADPGRARVVAGQAIRADAAFARFGTSEVVLTDDVGAAGWDPGAGMGMCLVCDAAGRYRRSVQSEEFPVVVIALAVSLGACLAVWQEAGYG
jgi:hypothetical protein